MTTGAPSSAHCRTIREDTPNAAPISFHPDAKLAKVRGMNVSCLSIAGLPALRGYWSLSGRTCLANSAYVPSPFNPAVPAYPCEPYAGIVIIWRVMLPFAHRPALRTTARVCLLQLFFVHHAGYPAIAHMPPTTRKAPCEQRALQKPESSACYFTTRAIATPITATITAV